MNKRLVGLGIATFSIGVIVCALFFMSFAPQLASLYGNVGVDLETTSVHCRIRMWRDGVLVFDEYHAGVVTDIGDNHTLYWVFGDSAMKPSNGSYSYNVTYISIGNQDGGSLSTSSTQLPGEWNRTFATIEDQTQSALNLTCTFYPATGPYTADCIGLNWHPLNASNGNLWGYDTFTEVTGIDDSFEINIEFKVSVSHSA